MDTRDIRDPQKLPMADKNGKPFRKRNPSEQTPSLMKGKGMGDYAQFGEPFQKHWDVEKPNIEMPPARPVIRPPIKIEERTATEYDYLANRIKQYLSCNLYYVKNPNWVEPPISAHGIDISTNSTGIAIPAGAPGAWVQILVYTVPDRFVGVIKGVGNALEDDAAFPNVEWQFRINDRPLSGFQTLGSAASTLRIQFGDAANPFTLAMPIVGKYRDVIELRARSIDGNAHTAYARWVGWSYPVRTITNDGSYTDYHQV